MVYVFVLEAYIPAPPIFWLPLSRVKSYSWLVITVLSWTGDCQFLPEQKPPPQSGPCSQSLNRVHMYKYTNTHTALNINIGCQQMSPRNRDNHPDSTDSLQAQWTKKFRVSLLYSHLPGTRHCSTLMRVCYQGPSP